MRIKRGFSIKSFVSYMYMYNVIYDITLLIMEMQLGLASRRFMSSAYVKDAKNDN